MHSSSSCLPSSSSCLTLCHLPPDLLRLLFLHVNSRTFYALTLTNSMLSKISLTPQFLRKQERNLLVYEFKNCDGRQSITSKLPNGLKHGYTWANYIPAWNTYQDLEYYSYGILQTVISFGFDEPIYVNIHSASRNPLVPSELATLYHDGKLLYCRYEYRLRLDIQKPLSGWCIGNTYEWYDSQGKLDKIQPWYYISSQAFIKLFYTYFISGMMSGALLQVIYWKIRSRLPNNSVTRYIDSSLVSAWGYRLFDWARRHINHRIYGN